MAKQNIGEFLATLRRANGFTQQEVADRLGISNRTLSAWERGTALPDILLLPALAELYGVTADEILKGERKQTDAPTLSAKSETGIFKNRLARFTMQACILTGIICVGVLLMLFGILREIRTVTWVGWKWWVLLLFVGVCTVVVGFSVLVAFWKGAESAADETSEKYGSFCTFLRGKFAVAMYVISAAFCAGGIVSFFIVLSGSPHSEEIIAVRVAFVAAAAVVFAFGWTIRKKSLLKYGGETVRQAIKSNDKLYGKTTLLGLIPLAALAVIAIVLHFATYEVTTVVYGAEESEFLQHFESIEVPESEFDDMYFYPDDDLPEHLVTQPGRYFLALSEVAKTAEVDEEIYIGDGFYVRFYDEKEGCMIYYTTETGYSFLYHAVLMTSGDGNLSVYVCLSDLNFLEPSHESSEIYIGYPWRLEKKADGWVDLLYVKHYNYESGINYFVYSGVVVADIAVCLTICCAKRKKIHFEF